MRNSLNFPEPTSQKPHGIWTFFHYPPIPRKTAYPFKNTIIKFKRIISKDGVLFEPIFPFYCQFRLCITTALFRAAAKADAGKARAPVLKNYGGKYFEKATENRNHFNESHDNEMNMMEKLRLEKILRRKISNEAFHAYCTREDYEREQGISM